MYKYTNINIYYHTPGNTFILTAYRYTAKESDFIRVVCNENCSCNVISCHVYILHIYFQGVDNMAKLSELNLTDKCRPESLWSAADVWIKKPHVVNKRLCGATESEYRDVNTSGLKQFVSSVLRTSTDIHDIIHFLCDNIANEGHETAGRWCVCLRTLIPKVNKTQCLYKEIVIKGKTTET